MSDPLIGGLPPVRLSASPAPGRPSIVEAVLLPGRGAMLLQAVAALPSGARVDLLEAPSLGEAAARLDGGPDDFAGNASFAFGGALLVPYANRIRGRALEGTREIEAIIGGRAVRLPRNWGGKAPGAQTYAMHGLLLATPVPCATPAPDRAVGHLRDHDFGGRWPGRMDLEVEWRLSDGGLRLRVAGRNLGPEPLPFGVGWHPYFRIPSGARAQAELAVPARLRAEVDNYDEVLPTGRLLPVAGSDYDFAGDGRRLGDQYLDDCFTDLMRVNGEVIAELRDPAAGLGLRIDARAPPVHAFQVYAPPDQAFVALEPQFNLADPFGDEWAKDVDTGMAWIPPGGEAIYEVGVTLVEI